MTLSLEARLAHYCREGWPRSNALSFNEISWRDHEPWSSTGSLSLDPNGRRVCILSEPEPMRIQDLFGLDRFSGVIDHLNDVLLVAEAQPIDLPGPRVLFVNEAFERMTGYSRHQIIGHTPRMLQGERTEPEVRARIREHLACWRPFREQLTNYRQDGRSFMIELDVSPVADPTGWFIYWVAIQRDVTERERRFAIEAQANRVQTIEAVAGGIAHDLNNRLALVSVEIEQVLAETESPERRALIDEALVSLQDTQAITRQFFSLRGSAGDEQKRCHVQECLRHAVMLGSRGADMQIHLEVGTEEPLYVGLSPGDFERVMLNLLMNAQQAASGAGRLQVEVWVSTWRDGDEVVVRVRDNGPGVPEHLRARIFDPYLSTKEDGNGLGLAICVRAMSDAGGSIVLGPAARDGGAVFELRAPATGAWVPSSSGSALQLSRRSKILLVEDEPRLLKLWQQWIEKEGFYVVSAESEREAIAALERESFDLLVTDLNLESRRGGFDVIRAFVARTPGAPHILITGGDVQVERALMDQEPELELEHCLEKPFRTQELIDEIVRLLGESRSEGAEGS